MAIIDPKDLSACINAMDKDEAKAFQAACDKAAKAGTGLGKQVLRVSIGVVTTVGLAAGTTYIMTRGIRKSQARIENKLTEALASENVVAMKSGVR